MQNFLSNFDLSKLNILLAITGVVITILTMSTARIQIKTRQREYYWLNLVFIFSFIFVILTKNWIVFIIAWEMITVTTALMLLWKSRGLSGQYLIIQFFGSSLLICFILIAYNNGYPDIMPISESWLQNLLIIGLGMKSAIFGLHFWLPAVHSQAPAPVSAILSGWVVKLGFITYIKIIPEGNILLIVLGLLMIFYAGIKALLASDYKVLLAYSSISQLGFIAIGIGSGTALGILGSVLHILAHSLAKTGLFIGSGYLLRRYDSRTIYDFKGADERPRIINFSISFSFASLMGAPLLLGFNSKYLIKHSFYAEQAFNLNKLLPMWLKSIFIINKITLISSVLEQMLVVILYAASMVTALYSLRFIYIALVKGLMDAYLNFIKNMLKQNHVNSSMDKENQGNQMPNNNIDNDNIGNDKARADNYTLSKIETMVLSLIIVLLLTIAFYSVSLLSIVDDVQHLHFDYFKGFIEFIIIILISIFFLYRVDWFKASENSMPTLDRLFHRVNRSLHRTARFLYNIVYIDFQYQLLWVPIFLVLMFIVIYFK